jgi:hypothetical protein
MRSMGEERGNRALPKTETGCPSPIPPPMRRAPFLSPLTRGEDIHLNRRGFTGSALSGSSGQACLGYLPRMSERTEG